VIKVDGRNTKYKVSAIVYKRLGKLASAIVAPERHMIVAVGSNDELSERIKIEEM